MVQETKLIEKFTDKSLDTGINCQRYAQRERELEYWDKDQIRSIATEKNVEITLWRKGFRSAAHCYSGCEAGEVSSVFIAAGLLSLGNMWVAAITFFFAYVFGYGMTLVRYCKIRWRAASATMDQPLF